MDCTITAPDGSSRTEPRHPAIGDAVLFTDRVLGNGGDRLITHHALIAALSATNPSPDGAPRVSLVWLVKAASAGSTDTRAFLATADLFVHHDVPYATDPALAPAWRWPTSDE